MQHPADTIRQQFGLALLVAIGSLLTAMALSLLPASGNTLPKPTDVDVEVVSTGMKVTWEEPDTSNATLPGQLLSYKIERQEGLSGDWEDFVNDTKSTTTTLIDTTGGDSGRFEAGIAYFYRVSAIYDDGNDGSTTSNPSHHGVRVAPSYPMPTDLDRDDTTNGTELEWVPPDLSSPSLDGIPALSGYQVTVNGSSGSTHTLASTASTWTHSSGDFKDDYEIIAIYGKFESREARFDQGTPPPVPAPTNLSGSAKNQGLEITWDAPDTSDVDLDIDVVGYEILRRRAKPAFETHDSNTNSTSTTYLDNLTESNGFFIAGQEYSYQVRAIYKDDEHYEYRSDPSDSTTVSVPNYLKPDNFSSDVSGGDIELEWDAPTISWNANRHGLTGYRLTITTPSNTSTTVSLGTGTTSYTYDPSENGSYTFQIVAIYFIFSSGFDSTLESIGGE
ncbi:MAG: fibronectin type III domain-containing protein [Chloroflexi bacterium]|nr:fibronectin type III domain-containing protein [Chloroflexota bacterium]MCY3588020.1 fibronectin type III domain-containing protein [Chloroflexota bacterium]MDE2709194.1 fibronectin type III domain-containing protein [Chloroflexota bacterium]